MVCGIPGIVTVSYGGVPERRNERPGIKCCQALQAPKQSASTVVSSIVIQSHPCRMVGRHFIFIDLFLGYSTSLFGNNR